jgi:hypothetical protein
LTAIERKDRERRTPFFVFHAFSQGEPAGQDQPGCGARRLRPVDLATAASISASAG